MLVDADHSLAEILRKLSKHLGIVEVCNGLNDSSCTLLRIAALEDTRTYKYALSTKLHHKSSVSRCSNTTGSEVYDGKLAVLVYVLHQVVGNLKLLSCLVELVLRHRCETTYLALHHAHVANSLYYVTCSRLALCTDHCGTLSNTAQSLAKIACSTHEGNLELVLVDMVNIVSGRENPENNVVMIPLRKVAEQLGYTVTWDPDDQSVRVEMNIAYIIVKPGEDWYERIGTIKKVNLNHIFQYGAGPVNVNGTMYVPAQLFEAFYNSVSITPQAVTITPASTD